MPIISYYPRTIVDKSIPKIPVKEVSWWRWLVALVASFIIDLGAKGVGWAVGAITTILTGSPAIGIIAGGATQAVVSAVGNILLDYATDNFYNQDGSVNWTNLALNVVPVVGFVGFGKIKQGVQLLRQERALVANLIKAGVKQEFISFARRNSIKLLDKNYFLKQAKKVNDINFLKSFIDDSKSAIRFKTQEYFLKATSEGRIILQNYSNVRSINVATTLIMESQKNSIVYKYGKLGTKINEILKSKTGSVITGAITKTTKALRYINPTYAIRQGVQKALRPISKAIEKAVSPLLKQATKRSKILLKNFAKYGIIPVNSSVIMGYQVVPLTPNTYKITFVFKPQETNFKKNVSTIMTIIKFQEWVKASTYGSPMKWYLDNIALSRGGRQAGGNGLFVKQLGYTFLNAFPTLAGKAVYSGIQLYRAGNYVRSFGARNKQWQGFNYWANNVANKWKDTGRMQDTAWNTTKRSGLRSALKIAGAGTVLTGIATSYLLSNDRELKKRKDTLSSKVGKSIVRRQLKTTRNRVRRTGYGLSRRRHTL